MEAISVKKHFLASLVGVTALSMLVAGAFAPRVVADNDDFFVFIPDTLVLSRSVYAGNSSTVTVGQTLPPGCVAGSVPVPLLAGGSASVKVACGVAVADGTYPTVFNNDGPDGSFGITSPIFLDDITTDGHLIGSLSIPSSQIVTSFSSKSELALNLSTDGRSITFGGYRGGPGFVTGSNQLDVSNSKPPGVVDPTNPVVSQYYRSVGEVDAFGHLQITEGNAYSGNNGRAAIKAHSLYYMTGNDNKGGLSSSQLSSTQIGLNLVSSTGAELLVPGQAPPLPPNINKIGTFSITQVIDPTTGQPYAKADKAGKDNNFRGLTIFDNTLYITKGSGGNGINTVYQVGSQGVLPSGDVAALAKVPITILPGFPTTLAAGADPTTKAVTPVLYPFGIWFANPNTLYVCDEGDGTLVTPAVNGNVATPDAQMTAGVQKWILVDGVWQMAYVMNNGLNIGVPYSVDDYPAALNPATGGCLNMTGQVHQDGTVTIYAVTSTLSNSGDQGADPNKLFKVTDVLKANSLPSGDGDHDQDGSLGYVKIIRSAKSAEVFRGVDFAPQDRGDDK